MMHNNQGKGVHLLVLRFSALGDVLMTIPVIYSLSEQYPEMKITVVSRPFFASVFHLLPSNVTFVGVDLKEEYKGVWGLRALYRRLAAMEFTHVADLHDVLRTKYLRMGFHLAGLPVAHIDKERKRRKELVTSTVKQPLRPSFQKYADVFERLGFPVQLQFHSLFKQGAAPLSQLSLPFQQHPEGENWVGIAPFAAHAGKIYPLDKMEQVVEHLSRHEGTRIFLFGAGSREKDVLQMWSDKYPNTVMMAGRLHGLAEELALISHFKAMVTMDSANMHLASLAAVPVVSVWGATHPMAGFLGWGQHEEDVVQEEMNCRPCSIYGNKPCRRGDYACLNGISPLRIVEKVLAKF